MRDRNINYAVFAEIWNDADSAAAVAKTLNVSIGAVYSRLKSAKALGHECKVHSVGYSTDDEFIAVYRAAGSDAEVAEKFGMSPNSVRQRAVRIREKGVELPYRRHQGKIPGQGMATDPLEEYEAQPEKPTSIRLGAATRRQIRWLEAQGHGNQSKIISLAIHAMWSQEQSAG